MENILAQREYNSRFTDSSIFFRNFSKCFFRSLHTFFMTFFIFSHCLTEIIKFLLIRKRVHIPPLGRSELAIAWDYSGLHLAIISDFSNCIAHNVCGTLEPPNRRRNANRVLDDAGFMQR